MIRLTIEAATFAELMTMIRDVPVGAVVAPSPVPFVSIEDDLAAMEAAGVTVTRTTQAPVEEVMVPVQFPSGLVPVSTEEVDSAGEVWDAEKHASSKAKNKDGTWRAKRVVSTAQAEPVVQAPVAAPVEPVAELTFNDLMTLVSRKMSEGKMTLAKLGEIQVMFGLENISMVGARPDLIGPVYNVVDAL